MIFDCSSLFKLSELDKSPFACKGMVIGTSCRIICINGKAVTSFVVRMLQTWWCWTTSSSRPRDAKAKPAREVPINSVSSPPLPVSPVSAYTHRRNVLFGVECVCRTFPDSSRVLVPHLSFCSLQQLKKRKECFFGYIESTAALFDALIFHSLRQVNRVLA